MDVRIGITQAPRELELELADDLDEAELLKKVESALSDGAGVLWLTDKRGRRLAVAAAKLAYVELGSSTATRRVGYGA